MNTGYSGSPRIVSALEAGLTFMPVANDKLVEMELLMLFLAIGLFLISSKGNLDYKPNPNVALILD
jgi:hypothetical protein